jgi:hypothetical protein
MTRIRSRAEMERAATICVAIHNAHCTDNTHCIQLEDLCPWLSKPRREPEARMTMAEVGELFNHKFPGT